MTILPKSSLQQQSFAAPRAEAETAEPAADAAASWAFEGSNNFDFIRFVLAAFVIFSHSWQYLFGLTWDDPSEWFMRLTQGQGTAGYFAVDLFFIASGAMLVESWARSRSPRDWFRRRILRIYPGYIAATLVLWGVFGYLLSRTPMSYLTYFTGLPLHPFLTQVAYLRLAHVPTTVVYNSPTWTIPFEAACYIVLGGLGFCGLLRSGNSRRWATTLVLALTLGTLFALESPLTSTHLHQSLMGDAWFADLIPLPWRDFWPRFLSCFFAGAAFASWRERIPRRPALLLTCLGLLIASTLFGWGLIFLTPVAGAYCLFWAASARWPALLRDWSKRVGGDYSYGMYLYSCPLQLLLARHLGQSLNPLSMFALALPLSILAGVLSWHLVEKRFLGRRRHHAPRENTVSSPAP